MKVVLVTGSSGFIGKNLIERLIQCEDVDILAFDQENESSNLIDFVKKADIIFHLAGVNRPEKEDEFKSGNVGLTQQIIDILEESGKSTPIVFSSSIQAALENPYGQSKKDAEDVLVAYGRKQKTDVFIYRLHNVFGKWCRPNYNSVVATFCHNISHGQDIVISDESKEIDLVYIDDVVNEIVSILFQKPIHIQDRFYEIKETFQITLGDLAQRIYQLRDMRATLIVPDMSDRLTRCLHATYLSYLDKKDFSYKLNSKMDERGMLTELIKSKHFGQVFVSTSGKGIVRGSHYHNTKIEKFCVLTGEAVIRFRHIFNDEILSYPVSGKSLEVVDIPPGYTHSIENTGEGDIVVLFWANQMFDSNQPDTYYCEVTNEQD